MINTVMFDWGGVLIDNPAPGLRVYGGQALGVAPDELSSVFRDYQDDFQKGLIAEQDLWKVICVRLDVPVPEQPSLYREAVENVFTPRAEVFDLAAKLKTSGYKTGFLSNTELPAMEYFHDQKYTCFDAAVFSCAEGVAKPDEKIYRIVLERLNSGPAETVFIDDREDYLEGARKCGISTIKYESFKQMSGELKRSGVAW